MGVVNGVDTDYDVCWLDEDLVMLSVAGDEFSKFCSSHSGGFRDLTDVMEQATDVIIQYENEDLSQYHDDEY